MEDYKISSRQVAMAFTGSFLGAGFISGQEIMQFFGVFGSYGLLGMVASTLLFSIFGSIVMKVANQTGIIEFDKIIVEKEKPIIRGVFSGVFLLFLFGVIVIMIAGSGALLHQLLGFPKIFGNILMAVGIAIISLKGAQGVLKAFSITVPLLIIVAIITSILSYFTLKGGTLEAKAFSDANPLIGNWFFSTIAFVSYNMMAAISILIPISLDIKGDNIIDKGIFRGSIQLIILFICILLPLTLNQAILAAADLPMVALAEEIHPILGIVYGIVLLAGIFGSGVSCFFGLTVRIRKYREIEEKRLILTLTLTAFIGSIVGFRELIGILFPIFGYIGFFGLLGILHHYLSLKKQKALRAEID